MYRAVAFAAIENSVDPEDVDAVTALAQSAEIDLEGDPDSLKVFLAGRDITNLIRNEHVTAVSSIVSSIPGVRKAMVARQREIAKRGAVLNGRDIGTVVFPNADLKFFLTAAPEERAKRRFEERREIDSSSDYDAILCDMIERDRRDSTRADSPLKIADDAIVIDSDGKSIHEVFNEMLKIVRQREKRGNE